MIEINNKTGKEALLVIDVQQGLFERSTPVFKAEELLENINILVNRAHTANVPVFYIQHSNDESLVEHSPSWQFHPQIQPQTKDSVVHKQHGNAFEETSLDVSLKALGVSHLVITGLVTHGCVKATCIGALALGYEVTLVSDAHSNFSKQAPKIIKDLNNLMVLKGAKLLPTVEVTFI